MNVIEVYQCEACGKESRNKEKLHNHEVQCKIQRKKEIERKKNKEKLDEEFLKTFHPSNLKECVNIYLDKCGIPIFEELHWEVNYYDHVSNSHSAPINGETNWGERKEGVPTGYPGFSGRIWGSYNPKDRSISEYCGNFSHDRVIIPGLHTGSGGGGGDRKFSYQFQFFLEDFPTFKEEFENTHKNKEVKAKLLGNYDYKIKEEYHG